MQGKRRRLSEAEKLRVEVVAKAKARCIEHGAPWTVSSPMIYSLLLDAKRPRAAYDLLAELTTLGQEATAPTIYRSLDALVRAGLIHRVETLKAYAACVLAAPHTAGFLICSDCRATEEAHTNLRAIMEREAELRSFKLETLAVEVRGQCSECHSTTA